MPTAPKRFGQTEQPPQKSYGWKDNRGTNNQRGYGHDWQKLSAAFKREHPFCQQCMEHGIVRESQHTDHVIPFRGVNDPKRLDWDNLMALCERCHMSKTGRQASGR